MTHEKERRSIQCFERDAGSSCRARDRRPRPSGYPPSLGPVPRLDPVPQRAGPETGRWTLVVWLTGVTIHHELANAQPFGRHPNRVTGLGRPRAGVPRTSTVGLCEVGTRIPRSCSPTSNSRIVVSPLMQSAPAASQAPQPTWRPGTSRDSSQLSRKGRPRSRTTGPSRADRPRAPRLVPRPDRRRLPEATPGQRHALDASRLSVPPGATNGAIGRFLARLWPKGEIARSG